MAAMKRLVGTTCLTFVTLLAAAGVPLVGAASTLVSFEIQDQFDHLHTDAEFAGRPLVLFGSDRKGSAFSGRWVEAVREALTTAGHAETIQLVEAADLRGVPFFVKGSVKKKFPREPAAWVLLDWRGHLARSYGFTRDVCSILLFDPDGRLTYRVAVTELDEEVLSELLSKVMALSSDGEEPASERGERER